MPHTVRCVTLLGETRDVPVDQFRFRPTVYGVLVRDGSVLLVRNRQSNTFNFPGGGIEIGELNKEALCREVEEEIGLKIDVGQLLHFDERFFYCDVDNEAWHAFVFYYHCTLQDGSSSSLCIKDTQEVAGTIWRPLTDHHVSDLALTERDVFLRLPKLLSACAS